MSNWYVSVVDWPFLCTIMCENRKNGKIYGSNSTHVNKNSTTLFKLWVGKIQKLEVCFEEFNKDLQNTMLKYH